MDDNWFLFSQSDTNFYFEEMMTLYTAIHNNIPQLITFLRPDKTSFPSLLLQDVLLLHYRAVFLSQLWDDNHDWDIEELLGISSIARPWKNLLLWQNSLFSVLKPNHLIVQTPITELFPLPVVDRADSFIDDLHLAHERLLGLRLIHSKNGVWKLESSADANRKTTGSFYTPVALIERIVDQLFTHIDQKLSTVPRTEQEAYLLSLRFCDPSCGTGHFLRYLQRALGERLFQYRSGQTSKEQCILDITKHCLYGADINPLSVALCQLGLWWTTRNERPSNNFIMGDALQSWMDPEGSTSWQNAFPQVFHSGGFDYVIGNPPYVDAETMKKQLPRERERYKKEFQSARGNWDLYIPFSELGLLLLKPNGIVALLTPNNILGADYAKALQGIWLKNQLLWIQDFSAQNWFEDAKISVVAVACQKKKVIPEQNVYFYRYQTETQETIIVPTAILQRLPSGYISFPLQANREISLEWLRKPQLHTIASCSDGASTKEAYEIRELVYEGEVSDQHSLQKIKLLNTGTIDPFQHLWGKKECRYLGFRGKHPVINSSELQKSHPKRWQQALTPKLLIAGLSARIEAVLAPPSYLCGKTTTQIIPKQSRQVCLTALCCYLNSNILFQFYRSIFAMRGFSSRSFLIGPRQIELLPVPDTKYFSEWLPTEDLRPENQLSYWGAHWSEIDPDALDAFILDILK